MFVSAGLELESDIDESVIAEAALSLEGPRSAGLEQAEKLVISPVRNKA